MRRVAKLLLIAAVALNASFCCGQSRVFVAAKATDRITLRDDGSCSIIGNGRITGEHYEINGKRITFNVKGRHVEGFWYGDVIRYPRAGGYKSFSLAKPKKERR